MKTGDKRIRSTICHGCLQAGPSVRRAYTMVYFKVSQNFNGTLAIRRIVMVYFQSSRIVMAPFQKTLKKNAHDVLRYWAYNMRPPNPNPLLSAPHPHPFEPPPPVRRPPLQHGQRRHRWDRAPHPCNSSPDDFHPPYVAISRPPLTDSPHA